MGEGGERQFLGQELGRVTKEFSTVEFQLQSIPGKPSASSAENICQLLPNEGEPFFQWENSDEGSSSTGIKLCFYSANTRLIFYIYPLNFCTCGKRKRSRMRFLELKAYWKNSFIKCVPNLQFRNLIRLNPIKLSFLWTKNGQREAMLYGSTEKNMSD